MRTAALDGRALLLDPRSASESDTRARHLVRVRRVRRVTAGIVPGSVRDLTPICECE